ncbi:MAG: enoyl-CoA hydratase/isomerase family protein [Haloferacaceae archaeon]
MTEDPTAALDADHETVRVDVAGGVATVTVDRPEARNALDATVREELIAVLDALEADAAGAQVVVLRGSEGSGAFVAGADVTELRERDMLEQRRASERPRVYERVADLRWPTIAAINGHALGGGCELALACDVRLAAADAKIGQPEITLGIVPGGGGTQRLPRLVGKGEAMRLILTGDPVDAAEAADIGLVEAVHPPEELDDRAADLAASIAEQSPVAVEYATEAVRASERLPLREGLDYEAELFLQLFATGEKDEGIDAFLEGRDPEWTELEGREEREDDDG